MISEATEHSTSWSHPGPRSERDPRKRARLARAGGVPDVDVPQQYDDVHQQVMMYNDLYNTLLAGERGLLQDEEETSVDITTLSESNSEDMPLGARAAGYNAEEPGPLAHSDLQGHEMGRRPHPSRAPRKPPGWGTRRVGVTGGTVSVASLNSAAVGGDGRDSASTAPEVLQQGLSPGGGGSGATREDSPGQGSQDTVEVSLSSDDDWAPSWRGRSSGGTGRQLSALERALRAAVQAVHVQNGLRRLLGRRMVEESLQASARSEEEAPQLRRSLQEGGPVSGDAVGMEAGMSDGADRSPGSPLRGGSSAQTPRVPDKAGASGGDSEGTSDEVDIVGEAFEFGPGEEEAELETGEADEAPALPAWLERRLNKVGGGESGKGEGQAPRSSKAISSRLARERALLKRLLREKGGAWDGAARLCESIAKLEQELADCLRQEAELEMVRAEAAWQEAWPLPALADRCISFMEADSRQQGPYSLREIEVMLAAGVLKPTTQLVHAGFGTAYLVAALPHLCPEGLPATPQPQPRPRSRSRTPGPGLSHRKRTLTIQVSPQRQRSRSRSRTPAPRRGASRLHEEPSPGTGRRQRSRTRELSPDARPGRAWSRERSPGRPEPVPRRSIPPLSRERKRYEESAEERALRMQKMAEWEERRRILSGSFAHMIQEQVEMEVEEEEEGSDVEGCWYCRLVDGSEGGPFTLRQLRLALAQKEITLDTMVHEEEEGVSLRLRHLLPPPPQGPAPPLTPAAGAPASPPPRQDASPPPPLPSPVSGSPMRPDLEDEVADADLYDDPSLGDPPLPSAAPYAYLQLANPSGGRSPSPGFAEDPMEGSPPQIPPSPMPPLPDQAGPLPPASHSGLKRGDSMHANGLPDVRAGIDAVARLMGADRPIRPPPRKSVRSSETVHFFSPLASPVHPSSAAGADRKSPGTAGRKKVGPVEKGRLEAWRQALAAGMVTPAPVQRDNSGTAGQRQQGAGPVERSRLEAWRRLASTQLLQGRGGVSPPPLPDEAPSAPQGDPSSASRPPTHDDSDAITSTLVPPLPPPLPDHMRTGGDARPAPPEPSDASRATPLEYRASVQQALPNQWPVETHAAAHWQASGRATVHEPPGHHTQNSWEGQAQPPANDLDGLNRPPLQGRTAQGPEMDSDIGPSWHNLGQVGVPSAAAVSEHLGNGHKWNDQFTAALPPTPPPPPPQEPPPWSPAPSYRGGFWLAENAANLPPVPPPTMPGGEGRPSGGPTQVAGASGGGPPSTFSAGPAQTTGHEMWPPPGGGQNYADPSGPQFPVSNGRSGEVPVPWTQHPSGGPLQGMSYPGSLSATGGVLEGVPFGDGVNNVGRQESSHAAYGVPQESGAFGTAASSQPHNGNAYGTAALSLPHDANAFGTAGLSQPQNGNTFGTAALSQPHGGNAFGTAALSQHHDGGAFGTAGLSQPRDGSAFGTAGTSQPRDGNAFGTAALSQPRDGNAFETWKVGGPGESPAVKFADVRHPLEVTSIAGSAQPSVQREWVGDDIFSGTGGTHTGNVAQSCRPGAHFGGGWATPSHQAGDARHGETMGRGYVYAQPRGWQQPNPAMPPWPGPPGTVVDARDWTPSADVAPWHYWAM